MTALTSSETSLELAKHPGWKEQAGELVRTYHFADFPEAIRFVNRVAVLAEEAGHHPDIDIRYNQVRLALVSHDEGGITRKDFSLISSIAAKA